MHEMSLAESIIQIVEEAARRELAQRVRLVVLEIGSLSSVAPDALQFCFEVVARHSLAEGARLEIITVPGQGWCLSCATTVAMEGLYSPCPHCGGYQVQPTTGMEMRVKEIEIA